MKRLLLNRGRLARTALAAAVLSLVQTSRADEGEVTMATYAASVDIQVAAGRNPGTFPGFRGGSGELYVPEVGTGGMMTDSFGFRDFGQYGCMDCAIDPMDPNGVMVDPEQLAQFVEAVKNTRPIIVDPLGTPSYFEFQLGDQISLCNGLTCVIVQLKYNAKTKQLEWKAKDGINSLRQDKPPHNYRKWTFPTKAEAPGTDTRYFVVVNNRQTTVVVTQDDDDQPCRRTHDCVTSPPPESVIGSGSSFEPTWVSNLDGAPYGETIAGGGGFGYGGDFGLSSSGGGGTGGGGCVHVDSILASGHRAGDVKVGDILVLGSTPDLERRTGKVTRSETRQVLGYRIVTQSGVSLRCSDTAPIWTEHDGFLTPPALAGKKVATMVDGQTRFETVESVEHLGKISVQLLTVENAAFWAGEQPNAYLLHHNRKDPVHEY